MNGPKLLVIVIVLQSLILLGQWTGAASLPAAKAQIPDAGGQRQQMIEELRGLGAKLDRIAGILEGGKVQVRLASPDERK